MADVTPPEFNGESLPQELTFTSRVVKGSEDMFFKGMDLKYRDQETNRWYLMEVIRVLVNRKSLTAIITARFKEELHVETDRISSQPPRT